MTLYQKHRPEDFSEMVGNKEVVEALAKVFNLPQGQKPDSHVFLFTGEPGCGKTTAARICASKLEVGSLSLKKINSANNRGIDSARDIISYQNAVPMDGKVFVFIIDEVHKTTNEFQNAMLDILEFTPDHIYFFLCTTNPEKLLPALRSRCTCHEFKPLPVKYLTLLLKKVVKAEEIEIDDEVMEEIVDASSGSPRTALTVLEKVMAMEPDKALKLIRSGDAVIENEGVISLCRALLAKESSWANVAEALKGIEEDVEKIRYGVLGYMNSILLKGKDNIRAASVLEAFSEPFYNSGRPGLTLACHQTFSI
jgi:DNA polymerase-3 subunit gamma/tau